MAKIISRTICKKLTQRGGAKKQKKRKIGILKIFNSLKRRQKIGAMKQR